MAADLEHDPNTCAHLGLCTKIAETSILHSSSFVYSDIFRSWTAYSQLIGIGFTHPFVCLCAVFISLRDPNLTGVQLMWVSGKLGRLHSVSLMSPYRY